MTAARWGQRATARIAGCIAVMAIGTQALAQTADIDGHVTYYGSGQPVAGVAMQLTGPTPAATTTDASGGFALTGLSDGSWTLDAAKAADFSNGISALDAVYVLQAVVGLRTLTPEQRLACDVTGDGTLSALDAVRILQFAVGMIDRFPIATTCGSDWAFIPNPAPATDQQVTDPQTGGGTCQRGTIQYGSLAAPAHNQDFIGILFGDCTGNWQPSGGSAQVVSTATSTPSMTPTPSPTDTGTPSPSVTSTPSASATATVTATDNIPTATTSATPSRTPSATPSASPTQSATATTSMTPSASATTTNTPDGTLIPTASATETPTGGASQTPTASATTTATATATFTATPLAARPLGSVAPLTGPTPCGDQSCSMVNVSCTQLANNRFAQLKVGDPTGTPERGTIVFASGWDGTAYWDSWSTEGPRVISELRAAGFRTVQLKWNANWFIGASLRKEGFGNLACRPASVLRWVYDNLHHQSPDTAFCAGGDSNGASQVAFALTQYGLSNILSAVELDGGPNWARIDIGCYGTDFLNSTLWYSLNARETTDWGFGYPNDGSGPCAVRSSGFRSNFQEASLAYGSWPFVYPKTMVRFLFGDQDATSTAGHGKYYYSFLQAAGSPLLQLDIVPSTPHTVATTTVGADMIRDTFLNECYPR